MGRKSCSDIQALWLSPASHHALQGTILNFPHMDSFRQHEVEQEKYRPQAIR